MSNRPRFEVTVTNSRRRFTQPEAQARLGLRVRLLRDFHAVQAGTTGRVVATSDEIEPDGYEVIVEWELVGRGRSTRDYFTRDEFERSLIEV